MTRRSWCAFAGALILAALAGPVQAKPSDLPLPYQDEVTPRHQPVELAGYLVQQTTPGSVGYLMLEVGVPVGGNFTVPTLVPCSGPVEADLGNFEQPFCPCEPGTIERIHDTVHFGFSACPVTEAMAKLRPSIRRRLAGALLFGVHPLLTLLPVDSLIDFPCDHPTSVAFVNYQQCGQHTQCPGCPFQAAPQCPGCPYTMQQCQPCPQPTVNPCEAEKCEPQAVTAPPVAYQETAAYPGCPDMVQQCPANSCPAQSCQPARTAVCPYVQQQVTECHPVQIADPVVTCTVLENLDRLMKATRLFHQGQALVEQGRLCEALDCFCEAQQLCPGRFEEHVSQSLNAFVNSDVPMDTPPGASEEAEAPTSCKISECCPCFETMMYWLGVCNPPCCPSTCQDCPPPIPWAEERCEVEPARQTGTFATERKAGGLTLARSAVKKQLKVKVDVRYDETPLKKVLTDIQTRAGVNLLCEADVDLDQVVTAEAEEVALKKVLRDILHEAGLEYAIEGEVVKVSRKVNTVAYAVGHLTPLAPCVITGEADCVGQDVPCALVQTITTQVAPRTWEARGGRGTIAYDAATRTLVVTQTDAVHRQIADYLVDVCQLMHYAPEDESEDVETVSFVSGEPAPSCTPCPRCTDLHEQLAVQLQVDGLLKACRLEVAAGRHERAARMAREAHALDPERVQGEPLVYKMHLLQVTGGSEECEPVARPSDCTECPQGARCDDSACKKEPRACACKECPKGGCDDCACKPAARACACKECPKGGKCDDCKCKEETKSCPCKDARCKEGCKCCGDCPCNKEAKAACQADCRCCQETPGSAEECEHPEEAFSRLMQQIAPPQQRKVEIQVGLTWKGIRLRGAISVGPHKVHLRYEPRGSALWVAPADEPE